jgi:hypothetical protein
MSNYNILVVVWGHCLAHSVRVDNIVSAIEERLGPQNVSLIGDGKYTQDPNIIDQNRYQIIPVKQIRDEQLISRIRSGKFEFYDSDEELEERVQEYLRVFRELNGDMNLYIVDCPDQACAVALDVMADLGEIDPSNIVNIANINWTVYRGKPIRMPTDHPIGNRVKQIGFNIGSALHRVYERITPEAGERVAERLGENLLIGFLAPLQLRLSTRRYNRVYEAIIRQENTGRKGSSEPVPLQRQKYLDARELFTGTSFQKVEQTGLLLCPDLEIFDPPSGALPDHVRYIGPLPYNFPGDIPDALNSALERAEEERKAIVYMSMGSTGDPDVINTILRYFESVKNDNYFLIFNTGSQEGVLHHKEINSYRAAVVQGETPPSDSYPFYITDNMYVTDYLPGAKIIAYADVVLFHGGSTTFWQVVSSTLNSIRTGIGKSPALVAVSTHMDQEDIGRIIEQHGLGIHLRAKNLRRDALANDNPIYQMHLALRSLLEQKGIYGQKLRSLCEREIQPHYDPSRMGQVAAEHIISKYSLS